MQKIEGNMIPKYDAMSREIEKAATILESISLAGLHADAQATVIDLVERLRQARSEFFSAAHAAFLRARAGEV